MTAAIDAKVTAMSRGQLEAAVTLLRNVAVAAHAYRKAVVAYDSLDAPGGRKFDDKTFCAADLDRALLKVGMP